MAVHAAQTQAFAAFVCADLPDFLVSGAPRGAVATDRTVGPCVAQPCTVFTKPEPPHPWCDQWGDMVFGIGDAVLPGLGLHSGFLAALGGSQDRVGSGGLGLGVAVWHHFFLGSGCGRAAFAGGLHLPIAGYAGCFWHGHGAGAVRAPSQGIIAGVAAPTGIEQPGLVCGGGGVAQCGGCAAAQANLLVAHRHGGVLANFAGHGLCRCFGGCADLPFTQRGLDAAISLFG